MSKVAVQLLSYNGERFLAAALDSLTAQTFRDFEVLILDNASTDGSRGIIENRRALFGRPSNYCTEEKNLGFVGGHNKLFAHNDAEYLLCMNQDVVLAPDYIEKLVAFADAHPDTGAVSGKLMRMGIGATIDSAGLVLHRSCHVADIGAGASDIGQFDGVREVFGVSGALPLYRRVAVEDVSPDGMLFDFRYFAYKEDVDLAWRLRLRGWKAYVVGGAVAEHVRSVRSGELRHRPTFLESSSYRNHLSTVVKNVSARDFLFDAPWILSREFARLAYLTFMRPSALSGLAQFLSCLPETLRQRDFVQSRKIASVRPWIN
jgi:GT2 family glycosyltransferase